MKKLPDAAKVSSIWLIGLVLFSNKSAASFAFDIDEYCASLSPSNWSDEPLPTQKFLDSLELPVIHPFCGLDAPRPYEIEGIPSQGPLVNKDHLETWWDVCVTIVAMGVPSLAAMTELWLRLFASAMAPLGLTFFILDEMKKIPPKRHLNNQRFWSLVCILSVLSSLILLTDTLYVLESGPAVGAAYFGLNLILSIRVCRKYRLLYTLCAIGFIFVALLPVLVVDFNTFSLKFGHPDDHVEITEGLYYSRSNDFVERIVDNWPEKHYSYNAANGATQWMPTGDARTGLPFLINRKLPDPSWIRLWLQVEDGEVVALDISSPKSGHDPSKTVYFLLHGLNGGSSEHFVVEFTRDRNEEGHTVVVMVARGLMDLPVRGWNVFHGARWTDAHEAASTLRRGLVGDQMLAGVGYSMGGIILSNYIARSGTDCALDSGVSISGGLDMRFEENFYRALRLWQPIVAAALRDNFVVGKWGERVRARLSKSDMKKLMRGTHVTDIDKTAVVIYNGFRDVQHYYSEMSALGDVSLEEYVTREMIPEGKRIHNVSIPFLVVQAFDDPLVTYRCTAQNEGPMHPQRLTRTGNGNLMILMTKRGGHVGWPIGNLPWEKNWSWMNTAASSFTEAVHAAKRFR